MLFHFWNNLKHKTTLDKAPAQYDVPRIYVVNICQLNTKSRDENLVDLALQNKTKFNPLTEKRYSINPRHFAVN